MSIQGLPTVTTTTTTVQDIEAPPTSPLPHGEGLGQIQAQVPLAPPPPQDAPVEGHPAEGLHQIQAPAPHQLDGLTGKSASIRQGLPDDLAARLDHRLAAMTAEQRTATTSLLHFPWYGRGGTTAETRLQIRTILANFIAQGGSLEQAQALKTKLKAADAATLPGRLADLNRQADPSHGLTPASNQQLADRIAHASEAEQRQIASLLSTPVDASTELAARRADTGTIMAACLAQGMGLGQAEILKHLLSTQPANTVAQMATEMAKADAKAFGVLSSFLLDAQAPDRGRFELVRNMVSAFPADLARAGRTEHVDNSTTLARDAHGRLDVAHAAAGFVRIGPADPYPALTGPQKQQITDAFTHECAPRYGRMGVALDMMGAFSAENARRRTADPAEAPIALRDFARTWNADGAAAMARYGKGDCMTAAQALVNRLAGQGITAYLGGVTNSTLMQQRHASNGIPTDGRLNTMGINHTDVLIPYRSDAGEDRVMLITPGMGNLDAAKFCRDLPANHPDVTKCRVGVSQDLNPSEIQKSQLGFLTNLLINDRAWDSQEHRIVGIDLVKGTIGLSGAATTRFRAAHGADFAPDKTTLVFDYRDALANPDAQVTVKVWDGPSSAYRDQTMTKLESLTLFLRAVQDQYGQPPEFVRNTLALLTNEQAYHQDILWASTRELNELP